MHELRFQPILPCEVVPEACSRCQLPRPFNLDGWSVIEEESQPRLICPGCWTEPDFERISDPQLDALIDKLFAENRL